MELSQFEIVAGIFVALGGLVLSWLKWLYPMWKEYQVKRKKNRELLEDIATDVRSMKPKVEKVYAEVMPNGDHSLKDTVNRIDNKITMQESMQKAALNTLEVAYWISNDNGACIEASHNLCKLLDRQESDILGANWEAWIHQGDREQVAKEWQHAMESKRPFDMHYRFYKPDGAIIKVRGRSTPIYGKAGKLQGHFGHLKIMDE